MTLYFRVTWSVEIWHLSFKKTWTPQFVYNVSNVFHIFFLQCCLLGLFMFGFFFPTVPYSKTIPSRILYNLLWSASDCVIHKNKVVFHYLLLKNVEDAVLVVLLGLGSRENLLYMLTNILLWCCNLIIVLFNYIFIWLRMF